MVWLWKKAKEQPTGSMPSVASVDVEGLREALAKVFGREDVRIGALLVSSEDDCIRIQLEASVR